MKYNTEIRVGLEVLWSGKSINDSIVSHCDSLRHLLYNDTVKIPVSLQIISRLSVETFNIATRNSQTNYEELTTALNTCKDKPTFFDSVFLYAAMNLGDHSIVNLNDKRGLLAYFWALKCVLYNEKKFESFKSQIFLRLSYGYASLGDYEESAKWQERYIISGPSDNYLDSLFSLVSYFHQLNNLYVDALFESLESAARYYNKECNLLLYKKCLDLIVDMINDSESVELFPEILQMLVELNDPENSFKIALMWEESADESSSGLVNDYLKMIATLFTLNDDINTSNKVLSKLISKR